MRPLKVGYVLKRFPRASETFIAQEILELERCGVEVEVFALRPNDQPVEHGWLSEIAAPVHLCSGVPLSEAWKWLHAMAAESDDARQRAERALQLAFAHPSRRGRHRLCEAVGLARAAAGRGIDHLHAHFANEPACVAQLAHSLVDVPFSFTAHAKDLYAKGPAAEVLARRLSEASFAVTVCEANRRHLRELLGPAFAERVRLLYNGVDLERLTPAPPVSGRAPIDVLCVARLVEKKGLDLLLRAVAQLRDRGLEPRCELVGEGPERGRLERLRAELDLEEAVTLSGCLPHEEVVARMRRAAVVTLPCRVAGNGDRDALPTVLIEAMACGLPVVSAPVGGVAEIVEHRRTGLLVPPDNPWALAAALGELLRQPRLRRRLGAAGRRRAAERFDRRQNVARLRAWIEAAAGRAGSATGPLRALEG